MVEPNIRVTINVVGATTVRVGTMVQLATRDMFERSQRLWTQIISSEGHSNKKTRLEVVLFVSFIHFWNTINYSKRFLLTRLG